MTWTGVPAHRHPELDNHDHQSVPDHKHARSLSWLGTGLVLPLLVSVIGTVGVSAINTDPKIDGRTAHIFLNAYYRDAVIPARQADVYFHRQTDNVHDFRQFTFPDFQKTFSGYSSVQVVGFVAVQGQVNAYSVLLEYHSKRSGNVTPEHRTFFLKCSDWTARIPLVNCDQSDIKVDGSVMSEGD